MKLQASPNIPSVASASWSLMALFQTPAGRVPLASDGPTCLASPRSRPMASTLVLRPAPSWGPAVEFRHPPGSCGRGPTAGRRLAPEPSGPRTTSAAGIRATTSGACKGAITAGAGLGRWASAPRCLTTEPGALKPPVGGQDARTRKAGWTDDAPRNFRGDPGYRRG